LRGDGVAAMLSEWFVRLLIGEIVYQMGVNSTPKTVMTCKSVR